MHWGLLYHHDCNLSCLRIAMERGKRCHLSKEVIEIDSATMDSVSDQLSPRFAMHQHERHTDMTDIDAASRDLIKTIQREDLTREEQRKRDIDRASIALIEKIEKEEREQLEQRKREIDPASMELIEQIQKEENEKLEEQRKLETDWESIALIERMEQEESALDEASRALAELIQEEELIRERKRKIEMQDQIRHCQETTLSTLNANQMLAVSFVAQKAKESHENSLPALIDRVVGLGFTEDNLMSSMKYIRDEAPIIIHLTWETLSLLLDDTLYRNRFETGTSGGSKNIEARMIWEKRLFGEDAYPDGCEPSWRPKYGCLNLCGDILGSRKATSYGKLFLTLESHVRYRSTFSDQDSSAADSCVATNDCYAHVLFKFSDNDLIALLNVNRVGGSRSRCKAYKEVQIHGPICLATDIQSLSLPGREQDASTEYCALVDSFQEKTNCSIMWQDDLLGT